MKPFPQIVLLHGWACDAQIWQPLVPCLGKFADIKAINIVYPSLVNEKTIDDLCHQLAQQIESGAILCGWSLGGMLATRIASYYPEKIKALITLASNPVFVANAQWPDAMPRKTFDSFFSLFTTKPEKALKRFMLLEVHGDEQSSMQLEFLQSMVGNSDVGNDVLQSGLRILDVVNNVDIVKALTCPSLFCFAENDALVPISVLEKMKTVCDERLLVMLPGSGHLLHYPVEKIEATLMNFLLSIK